MADNTKHIYRGFIAIFPPYEEGADILKHDTVTVQGGRNKRVARVRARLISRPYLPTPENKAKGRVGDHPAASVTVWEEDLFWFSQTCKPGALYYVEGNLSTGKAKNGKEYINLSALTLSETPLKGRAYYQEHTEGIDIEPDIPGVESQPMDALTDGEFQF